MSFITSNRPCYPDSNSRIINIFWYTWHFLRCLLILNLRFLYTQITVPVSLLYFPPEGLSDNLDIFIEHSRVKNLPDPQACFDFMHKISFLRKSVLLE